MTALQIGFLLPSRDLAARGEHDVSALLTLARSAEQLGFDSVWVGDSPLARPRADAITLLAAIAAVTSRVTIGSAVLLPALRHPVLLAQQLTTIDRISHGRLVIGAGAGFRYSLTQEQFEALGVPYAERIDRMEEAITAMRSLFAKPSSGFHGRHYAFPEVGLVPPPTRPGGPPIWLAGAGARALRRIGRMSDGWLPYPPDPTTYARGLAAICAEAAEAGRPGMVTPAMYVTVCLDENPGRARDRLRASIDRYYAAPLEAVEQVQALFAGTVEDFVEWLRTYADAGARHVILRLAVDDYAAALQHLADCALPRIKPGGTR